MKIENRIRKRSHKLDRIGVGRIRKVPFSSDSFYDSDAFDPVKTRLSESQAEAQEPINHNTSSQALRVQSFRLRLQQSSVNYIVRDGDGSKR